MELKIVRLVLFAVCFSGLVTYAECYKILGIFHTIAKSHAIVGQGLMKGLAEAGHDVTVISPHPQTKPLKNYRDVVLAMPKDIVTDAVPDLFKWSEVNQFRVVSDTMDIGLEFTLGFVHNPVVKQFLLDNKNTKFDLIVLEIFVNEALLGFGHYFNAPVIGLSPFGASKWTTDLVGTPSPLSYVPHPFTRYSDTMTFTQRFGNVLLSVFEKVYMDHFYMPKQVEIYDKLFPGTKPALEDLRRNVSLVLLNNHFTTSYPRPYAPNMIEVGGMHIRAKRNPIPGNILKFIESSKNGFIYFSMGSNLKSTQLPIQKRDDILKVFSKLNLNVLWKFEDENLPGKPDNVFISNWFPQDDILAHPNIKLFITHGGLLSTTEAVYNGVPIVGIPIFGDQYLNMEKTNRAGWGLTVPYDTLCEATLSKALNEMLSDPKFTENAKTVSKRYHDQPLTPLQTAVYWVEYIARHQGAPHLHSAGQNLNFFQYHNLDIFGSIILALHIVVFAICKLVRALFSRSNKTGKIKRH